MEIFDLFLPLALILAVGKFLSLICRKLGLPQVVGMLVAGILLGLFQLVKGQTVFTSGANGTLDGLGFLAEIGVVLLMFSAGIETDLKLFKSVGLPSVVITSLGIIFPMGLGFVVACAFNPAGGFAELGDSNVLLSNLFYGCILTATSVSLTVATLKEMGKLQTKVGASIVAAAILDDIIGIVILSVLISIKQNGAASAAEIGKTVGMCIAFFACAIVVGIVALKFVNGMDKHRPHTRRLPIFAFALCFFYAYAADKWFGIADITGAYMAGIMLSMAKGADYIDQKIDVSNYMVFMPVFFANIGINMINQLSSSATDFSSTWVLFGVVYVVVALLGKFLGCGAGAMMFKFGAKDSSRVGIGMMARAEVVLVCANMGVDDNLVSPNIMPFVVILIIVSSVLVPLLLKFSYRKEPKALNGMLDATPDDFSLNINNLKPTL